MSKRVGLLGGTFDPPHLGHYATATIAQDEFDLDNVVFVPTYVPPHKDNMRITAYRHRFEMARLMPISHYDSLGNPRYFLGFSCAGVEKYLPVPSRTFTMLKQMKEFYKKDKLFLIIGGDTLGELPSWENYEELLDLVDIIVVERPGCDDSWYQLPLPFRKLLSLEKEKDRVRFRWKKSKHYMHFSSESGLNISSTQIRQRIKEKRTIRHLVPPLVNAYIKGRVIYS